MSIMLPAGWTQPKYRFMQRVKYKRKCWGDTVVEEFGTIMGMTFQVHRCGSDLEQGWYYEIFLDEDSPGWQPHTDEIRQEDEIELW